MQDYVWMKTSYVNYWFDYMYVQVIYFQRLNSSRMIHLDQKIFKSKFLSFLTVFALNKNVISLIYVLSKKMTFDPTLTQQTLITTKITVILIVSALTILFKLSTLANEHE